MSTLFRGASPRRLSLAPLLSLTLGAWTLGCEDNSGTEEGVSDARTRTGDAERVIPVDPDAAPEDAAPAVDVGRFIDATPGADAAADAAEDDLGVDERLGSLEIEPARATLQIIDGVAPTLQLTVRRTFPNRPPILLDPAELAWTVDPATHGVVDETGLFTSTGREGQVIVEAVDRGARAASVLEIREFGDVITGGARETAPREFAEAERGENCAPTLLYPEDGTVFPRNITGVTFMWDARGHDQFELVFEIGGARLRWYTAQREVTPGGDEWAAVLAAGQGGLVRVHLTGLGGRGDVACAAPPITFELDRAGLTGAIYYWSTADFGIMRLAAGDTAPEPFLNPVTAPQINCPACHALSRDGSRIAYTQTTFPPFGYLATAPVSAPAQQYYNPVDVAGYFPSFAPDNIRIVAGSAGQLLIRHVETAEELERLPIPANTVGGSPDWSWQGEAIVATLGPTGLANPLPDVGISSGSIAEWHNVNGVWGAPNVLVEQEGGHSNDRPAYSPDGQFIAFERKGDSGGGGMGNASAELLFLKRSGGPVVHLARANRGPGMGNSWPKWSPADPRGRLWLAFSSTRDYGHKQVGSDNPQLWVTGILRDPADGEDPSAPSFWLPYQSLQSGNHIPYWAVYNKNPGTP